MSLKINDRVSGRVERVDEKGRGIVKTGAKDCLANFVIPGEEIEGTVTARAGGEPRVRVDKLVKASPDRAVPRCPYAGKCGGCPWQHITYERQCLLKEGLVADALAPSGVNFKFQKLYSKQNPKTNNQKPITAEFVPAAEQYRHRNRMDYVFGRPSAELGMTSDGVTLGLKEPEHWDRVIDLAECHMLSPEAVKVMDIVRSFAKGSGAPAWDNRRHQGFWRYLVIREGKNTGERLVMAVTSADQDKLPKENELAEFLKPLATSLVHGVNPEITDLSVPKTVRAVFGNPYLTEKVNGLAFRIPPASFFQTNTAMAAVLQDTVKEFAGAKQADTILDLYCGNGFLTLALAERAKTVVGVEIDEASIETARTNAQLNGIDNVIFSAGAAEALLPIALSRDKPETIVVDPPRSGLHPKALAALLEYRAPTLVYVSCNPLALARDLKTLLRAYRVDRLRCIDLFPHTPHIETIVSLKRNDS